MGVKENCEGPGIRTLYVVKCLEETHTVKLGERGCGGAERSKSSLVLMQLLSSGSEDCYAPLT